MTALGVAMIGCGTVGSGVAEILLGKKDWLLQRTGGAAVDLKHIVIRDRRKARPLMPLDILHDDWKAAIYDPKVNVVVELIGGTTTAKEMVLAALEAGKPIVTANKALLAAHGREIFDAARKAKVPVGFEAAVAGGIPIIKALAESLAANQVTALQGILNGTSNFILSNMAERGVAYATALSEAQQLGYAEADPTLDVDGSDAAHKLAVLVQIAFGVTPELCAIEKRGIAGLEGMDIRFAAELGYTIKLLAEAWRVPPTGVAMHVSPVLLRQTDMLAQVRGAFNAIRVHGDAVGETLFQGAGAGKMPTASSILSDLIDLAVGRATPTFVATNLWSGATRGFSVVPSERVQSRFYLRVLVKDQPGVLADVCRLLANEEISIASVVQHEALDGHPEQTVPLVIMTHAAVAGRFRKAVDAINRLTTICGSAVYYTVGD